MCVYSSSSSNRSTYLAVSDTIITFPDSSLRHQLINVTFRGASHLLPTSLPACHTTWSIPTSPPSFSMCPLHFHSCFTHTSLIII